MIIKKKYTISEQKNTKPQKEEALPPAEEKKESVLASSQKNENPAAQVKEDTKKIEMPAKKEVQEKPKSEDLDLSFDNIKFEQRAERREGSRRRGYRRIQDRNIVSRAQEDAQSIKEQAKKEGYEQGIENAKKEIEEIRNKFSEFYGYKDEIFDKVSDCIFDISIEIAKKILNKEIESDKTSIIPMIKSAVEEVNKTENKIVLKVMPQDVEIVKNKLPEIFENGGFEAAISVIPDKSIKESGVIVETSNGIIDATIQTQLSIMEKALCTNKESKE